MPEVFSHHIAQVTGERRSYEHTADESQSEKDQKKQKLSPEEARPLLICHDDFFQWIFTS